MTAAAVSTCGPSGAGDVDAEGHLVTADRHQPVASGTRDADDAVVEADLDLGLRGEQRRPAERGSARPTRGRSGTPPGRGRSSRSRSAASRRPGRSARTTARTAARDPTRGPPSRRTPPASSTTVAMPRAWAWAAAASPAGPAPTTTSGRPGWRSTAAVVGAGRHWWSCVSSRSSMRVDEDISMRVDGSTIDLHRLCWLRDLRRPAPRRPRPAACGPTTAPRRRPARLDERRGDVRRVVRRARRPDPGAPAAHGLDVAGRLDAGRRPRRGARHQPVHLLPPRAQARRRRLRQGRQGRHREHRLGQPRLLHRPPARRRRRDGHPGRASRAAPRTSRPT